MMDKDREEKSEVGDDGYFSWKSLWAYEEPKPNEIPVIEPSYKSFSFYVGAIGGYWYLRINGITPENLEIFAPLIGWLFVLCLSISLVVLLIQLRVAKRRSDRRFYIDKSRTSIRFFLRRSYDVVTFILGVMVMQGAWLYVDTHFHGLI